MSLDPVVDEIRLYTKEGSEYQRYIYVVEKSFETTPEDITLMLPDADKKITLIACTNGTEGRRIVQAQYKPEQYAATDNTQRLQQHNYTKNKHLTHTHVLHPTRRSLHRAQWYMDQQRFSD
jgi:sortase (surface protein transpeptidase)